VTVTRVSRQAPIALLRGRTPRGGIAILVLLFLLFFTAAARAEPPPERMQVLQRGINITAWFRFAASADHDALRNYMSDTAIAGLHQAGFTAVRLPVQPKFLANAPYNLPLLIGAIQRLQHAGLAVVVDAHPDDWHLETSDQDRATLFAFWKTLAPALRPLDPRLTFPELLNEPVFPNAPDKWAALQDRLLQVVRRALPQDTVVLTGNNWSSVDGLLALRPVDDDDVVYTFHFYEPVELTALASYRSDLDRVALARLPFPADPVACADVAGHTDRDTGGLISYYCSLHWDAARVTARIAAAAAWGQRNHAAVWLGEFGASAVLDPPARLAWLRAVREACETHGLGWALWGYDDVMGFAVPRPPGPHPALDPGVLRALGLNTPM
jgi:endoglucanase